MDVAHAILFAKTIDISRVTADYSSAKFEYSIRNLHTLLDKPACQHLGLQATGIEISAAQVEWGGKFLPSGGIDSFARCKYQ